MLKNLGIFNKIKTYAQLPSLVGANGHSPLNLVYDFIFCVSHKNTQLASFNCKTNFMLNDIQLVLGLYGLSKNSESIQGYELVDRDEALNVINLAYHGGIRIVDTAPCYGDGAADELLRILEKDYGITFRVNTKVGRETLKSPYSHEKSILLKELEIIKKNLRDSVNTVFFHSPPKEWLKNKAGLEEAKNTIKNQLGSSVRIGISFANPDDVFLVPEDFQFDDAQLNISILDLRVVKNNSREFLKQKGIEVYARSIFCSGILKYTDEIQTKLEKSDVRQNWSNNFVSFMQSRLKQVFEITRELNFSNASGLAFSPFYSYPLANYLVIGPTKTSEITEILQSHGDRKRLESIKLNTLVEISGT